MSALSITGFRWVAGIAGAVVVVALGCWVALRLWEAKEFTSALPAQIKVAGLPEMGGVGCGGALFSLSPAEGDAISQQGLRYFDSAHQARGPRPGWQRPQFVYGAWQETPVAKGWISEGSWAGLDCVKSRRVSEVVRAASEPGSYFTRSQVGRILVVPRLHLAVYTYDD